MNNFDFEPAKVICQISLKSHECGKHENIQKTVADYYKIKVADMHSKKRSRNFSRPRQVAMTLTRELTNLSFPEIAEAFGGRHHTTIMHACDEIEQLRLNDHIIGQDLGFLTQVLKG